MTVWIMTRGEYHSDEACEILQVFTDQAFGLESLEAYATSHGFRHIPGMTDGYQMWDEPGGCHHVELVAYRVAERTQPQAPEDMLSEEFPFWHIENDGYLGRLVYQGMCTIGSASLPYYQCERCGHEFDVTDGESFYPSAKNPLYVLSLDASEA